MPNWKKVVTSGSNAHLNQITASGNISSSGKITATNFIADDDTGYHFSGDNVRLLAGTGGDNLHINGGGLLAEGNITASGEISSSTTIRALQYNAGATAGSGFGYNILGEPQLTTNTSNTHLQIGVNNLLTRITYGKQNQKSLF